MPDAAAYDLSAGCTGFVYAIAQAHGMLAAGLAQARARRRRRRALEDPRLDRPLDARPLRRRRGRGRARAGRARAASSASSSAPTAAAARTSGCRAAARGASTTPEKFVKMNGREVFKFATRVHGQLGGGDSRRSAARRSTTSTSTFRTRRTSASSTTRSGSSASRRRSVVINVDRYGNTSSGSIPLALADAADDGTAPARQAGADDGDGRGPHVGLGADRMDTRDDWSAGMTKIAFMFPGQGSFEPGWARDRRGRARGDGRLRRGLRGVGPRPEASSASTAPPRSCRDRGAAAGARRDVASRSTRRCARAASGPTTSSATRSASSRRSASAQSLIGARGDRARARARPRDGGGREGAPRLDGGDPRPRRRGGRGALPARSRTCGRRTTTAPASSSSPARRPRSTRPASRRQREGARRAIRLRVSGAFHSPLVERAAERLRPAIEQDRLRGPTRAFMSTVTAKLEDAQRYRELLVEQLTAPVRFTQAARELIGHGVTTFVEVGPGNVLERFTEEDRQLRARRSPSTTWSRSTRPTRGAWLATRFASLEGKTALVTGASQGIGRAIAEELARAGATVVVGYRSGTDEAEELADGDRRPRGPGGRLVARGGARGSSRRRATSTSSSTTPA